MILSTVGAAAFYFATTTVKTDRASGCPDQYASVTVALIDLTDSINPVQAAALRNALLKVRDSVPKFGRLEIYPLAPTKTTAIVPLFAACNPGSGRDVTSELYGNAALANRMWKETFASRVDAVIAKIQSLPPNDSSPLFEGIQSVAVTAFGSPQVSAGASKRLVIVSDMLPFTPEFSMYAGAPDFQDFEQTQYFARVKPSLEDAQIDVYLIVRETRRNAQRPALYKFWVNYFDRAHAYLRDWEPLQ